MRARRWGAADRDRGEDRSVCGRDRGSAHRRQYFVRGARDMLGRAVRQDDAKAVAAQTSDMVADPDAGIEPAADLDQHRIRRGGAKAVVDRAHIIDADREEHRVARRTRDLFQAGRPVCDGVSGRLRYELRLTWLGGMRVLTRLERDDFNVFVARPALGAGDALPLAAGMPVWKSSAGRDVSRATR